MNTEELEVVHRTYRKKTSNRVPHFYRQRSMSVSDESSGDILPDPPPAFPTYDERMKNRHRNRRHSEFNSNVLINNRRNSAFQTTFWTNLFRTPSKSQLKNPSAIEQMAMKNELPQSSTQLINPTSLSHERLSPLTHTDSSSTTLFTFPSAIFTLDTSQHEPRSAETLILQLHTPLAVRKIYHDEFYSFFHTNYCGDLESDGPFLLSLRCFPIDENELKVRALIRTSNRNCDVSIKLNNLNDDHLLQNLIQQANLSSIQSCKVIGDPRANEKIEAFDKKNEERQNSKVGLIYQRANQKDEFELFANDGLSDELEEFLQFLGEKVRLKGFHRFRGDLDIRDDLHGSYSYYTEYGNYEIMFNVAPLIPSLKANGQCIERKGLVSNAFVCIVFQESDAEFTPELISGKVTQVYVTVQPLKIHNELYFKVGVWHRNDLTSIIDPPGGIIKFDQSFRDYFLTLLLNAIHVAIESPSLRTRVFDQRQRLKQEDLKKLLHDLTSFSPLDHLITFEVPESSPDFRSNSRSDSFININSLPSTTSTHETIPSSTSTTNTTGRTSPVATKKGRLSKLFDVFTTRSTNPPVPPPPPPPPAPPVVEPTVEIKRKPSVKSTHAPSRPTTIAPAIPTRRPIQPTQSIPVIHNGSSSVITPDHALPSEYHGRHRSNSSPANGMIVTKSISPMIPSINEENSSTSTFLSTELPSDKISVPSFDLS